MNNKKFTLLEKIGKCCDDLERLTNKKAMYELDKNCDELCRKIDVIGFYATLAKCALDNNDYNSTEGAINTIIKATKELSPAEHRVKPVNNN